MPYIGIKNVLIYFFVKQVDVVLLLKTRCYAEYNFAAIPVTYSSN